MDSLAAPLKTVKKGNPAVSEWNKEEKFPSIEETPKEHSLSEDDWNNIEDVEEIELDRDASTIFFGERRTSDSKSQGSQIFNEYELHRDKNRDKGRDESSERGSDGETSFSLPEFAPVAQAISMKWSEIDIITHISNEKAKQKQLDTKTNLHIDAKKNLKSNSKSKNSGIVSNFDSDSDNFSDNNGAISDFYDENKDDKEAKNIERKTMSDVKINKLSQFMKNNSNNSSTNTLSYDSDTNNNQQILQNSSSIVPKKIENKSESKNESKNESENENKKVNVITIEEEQKIIPESISKSAYSNFLRANNATATAGKLSSSDLENDEKDKNIPVQNRFSNFITNSDKNRDSGTDSDRERGREIKMEREKGRSDENMGIAGKGKIPKDYQRQNQEDLNFFDNPLTTSSNAPLSSKLPPSSMSGSGSGIGNQSTQIRSLPKGPKSPQHPENSSSSALSSGSVSKSTKVDSKNEKTDVKSEGKEVELKEWKGEQGLEQEDEDLCESSFDDLVEDPIDTSSSVVLDFNSFSLSPIKGKEHSGEGKSNSSQMLTDKLGSAQTAPLQSEDTNLHNREYDNEYDDVNDSIENWDNGQKSSENNLQFTVRESTDRASGDTSIKSKSNSRNEEEDDVLYGTTRLGGTKTLYNEFDDTQAFHPERSRIPDNKLRVNGPSPSPSSVDIGIAKIHDVNTNRNRLSIDTMTMDSLEGKNFKFNAEDNDRDLVYTPSHSESPGSDSNSNSLNFNLSQSSINFEMLRAANLGGARKLSSDEKKFDSRPVLDNNKTVDNNSNSKSSLQWQLGRAPIELIETGNGFDVFVSALKLHDDSYVTVSLIIFHSAFCCPLLLFTLLLLLLLRLLFLCPFLYLFLYLVLRPFFLLSLFFLIIIIFYFFFFC